MTDQDAKQDTMSSGCLGKMREMMRNMMSGKGGSCCRGTETGPGMMPECCPVQTEKKSPVENQTQEAPK